MSSDISRQVQYLTILRDQLVEFLDELIEQLPNEPDLVVARIFIKDKIPVQDIMNYIINKILPLKELIKTRNEHFFLDNSILFDKIDPNKVNYFKELWLSGHLDKDDKDIMWKWFDTFLFLAEKYVELSNGY